MHAYNFSKHLYLFFFFFFERQIWITDGPTGVYHRATSSTTRSYPSPLGNNAYIHQFRRKPNKCEKNPLCGNRTHDLMVIRFIPPPRYH
ncbi:hypothetical protein Hanom_Chr14g01247331 [Helianthus anomalus]